MKTKEDKDVIDRIDVVYYKNEAQPTWPIESSAVCEKNKITERHNRSYKYNLCEKWHRLVVIDWTDVVYDENQIGQRCDRS